MSTDKPSTAPRGRKTPPFRLPDPEPDVVTLHYAAEVGQHTPYLVTDALGERKVEFRGFFVHAPHHGQDRPRFDAIFWTDSRGAGGVNPHVIAGLVDERLEEDGAQPLGYSVEHFRAGEAYAQQTEEQDFYSRVGE